MRFVTISKSVFFSAVESKCCKALPLANPRRNHRRRSPTLTERYSAAKWEQPWRFVEEGGRTNLQRWGAAVDKTACRAGLLLCGDLTSAAAMLKAEEGDNGELLGDLIAFATSEAHAKLRKQLGIGVVN